MTSKACPRALRRCAHASWGTWGSGSLNPDTRVSLAFARQVRHRWRGMCSYVGDKKQGKAMCQRPNGVWAWEASTADYNPGFICGIAGQALQTSHGSVPAAYESPIFAMAGLTGWMVVCGILLVAILPCGILLVKCFTSKRRNPLQLFLTRLIATNGAIVGHCTTLCWPLHVFISRAS